MVKYIDVKNGCNLIKFDKETEEIKTLDNFGTNIDYMWIADEDGVLDDITINTGDIIIRMYGFGDYDRNKKVIVIKDEQLKNFYKEMKEYYEKQKAERDLCCDCVCENKCRG